MEETKAKYDYKAWHSDPALFAEVLADEVMKATELVEAPLSNGDVGRFDYGDLPAKIQADIRKNTVAIATGVIKRGIPQGDLIHPLELGGGSLPFCDGCGECCKRSTPIVACDDDVKQIARRFGLTFKAALKRYFKRSRNGSDKIPYQLKQTHPCQWLDSDGHCHVYTHRPYVCRQFPMRARGGQIGVGNYDYCKVPLNLYVEACFKEMGFRKWAHLNPEKFESIHDATKAAAFITGSTEAEQEHQLRYAVEMYSAIGGER